MELPVDLLFNTILKEDILSSNKSSFDALVTILT